MKRAVFLAMLLATARAVSAADEKPVLPKPPSYSIGFVFCSETHRGPALAYLAFCDERPIGRIACGTEVNVIRRYKDLLLVLTNNDLTRFVPIEAVSQRADKFVAFDENSGIADGGVPECVVPPERITPPRRIYDPEPEYSEQARRKKISGKVGLSFTVGTDGRTHDIHIEKALGYGLDEKAMEAVSRWTFEPAVKKGKPVELHLHAEVEFSLY